MGCDVGVRELCLRCDGYSALEPEGKNQVTDDHAKVRPYRFIFGVRARVTQIG